MAEVRCVRHTDPALYLEATRDWLLTREAEHNILLGILPQLAAGTYAIDGELYLATLLGRAGELVGCAFRTPPFHLGVTALPDEAIEPLVASASDTYQQISGVIGPPHTGQAVAESWTQRHGGTFRTSMQLGIHELREVRHPAPVAGNMRTAVEADADLVESWSLAFVRDTGVPAHDVRGIVDGLLRRGDLALWEVDGRTVSMAGVNGPTPNGIRVAYVYTPPEDRGRGYASAVVAQLSQAQLDAGRRFCFLYTDLANPTSNKIYRRIGYERVADSAEVVIER